jgi:hypothetical protein
MCSHHHAVYALLTAPQSMCSHRHLLDRLAPTAAIQFLALMRATCVAWITSKSTVMPASFSFSSCSIAERWSNIFLTSFRYSSRSRLLCFRKIPPIPSPLLGKLPSLQCLFVSHGIQQQTLTSPPCRGFQESEQWAPRLRRRRKTIKDWHHRIWKLRPISGKNHGEAGPHGALLFQDGLYRGRCEIEGSILQRHRRLI